MIDNLNIANSNRKDTKNSIWVSINDIYSTFCTKMNVAFAYIAQF